MALKFLIYEWSFDTQHIYKSNIAFWMMRSSWFYYNFLFLLIYRWKKRKTWIIYVIWIHVRRMYTFQSQCTIEQENLINNMYKYINLRSTKSCFLFISKIFEWDKSCRHWYEKISHRLSGDSYLLHMHMNKKKISFEMFVDMNLISFLTYDDMLIICIEHISRQLSAINHVSVMAICWFNSYSLKPNAIRDIVNRKKNYWNIHL